jgi:hypothetical protein
VPSPTASKQPSTGSAFSPRLGGTPPAECSNPHSHDLSDRDMCVTARSWESSRIRSFPSVRATQRRCCYPRSSCLEVETTATVGNGVHGS